MTAAGLLGWYSYKLTNKLLFLSESMEELYVRLDEFDQHINFIYELEMYYGDETLKNLIRHSRDLRNYMKTYRDVIELTEEETDTEENNEQSSEEDEDDEEKQINLSGQGKAIFHQRP
jgi:hypothetical protein